MPPIVSVIMPIYNAQKYLREAVDSILVQTLSDFELIILNDGSADSSHAILSEYEAKDTRIVYKNFPQNRGLPSVLNDGIRISHGKYIARMDQDDISLPERLDKQVNYMQKHPEVGICGSWVEIIGERAGKNIKFPCTHDEIYAKMLFENALVHPTVIMRSSIICNQGLFYDTQAIHIEDYELWSGALPFVRFANIPEPLLQYRMHGANTFNLHANKQSKRRAIVYSRFLSRLNIEYTPSDLFFHEKVGICQYDKDDHVFLQNVQIWFGKIYSANALVNLIEPSALKAELGFRWTQSCSFSQEQPYRVFLQILASPLPYKNCTGIMKTIRAVVFLARKLGRIFFRRSP